MSIPRASLVLALLFAAGPALAADPLAAHIRRMRLKGYVAAARAESRLGKTARLAAVVYEYRDGRSAGLYVYKVVKGKARPIHMVPGYPRSVGLAEVHNNGKFPILSGDGSRVLAYNVTVPSLKQTTLTIKRYHKGKLRHAADMPSGRFIDVDEDGKPEIVARSFPLGRFFEIDCESFYSMAQTAHRTSIYRWKGPRLERVSMGYPDFYADRIRRAESELAATDPRVTQDFGGYFGTAVSLYFDYAEVGRAEQGWKRLKMFFKTRWRDPKAVKRCIRQTEDSLRARLGIPANW